MTKLLERAMAQICDLPEDRQDAIELNLMHLVGDVLAADDERELKTYLT
jgi:hypothetical protein